MTYHDGYVLTIIKDGQTLKEVNNQVQLPFNAEYTIRVRNKTKRRAVADIYIDGRPVALGIVIQANDKIDLERFLEGHGMDKGPRLKFVPLADSRIQDKGEHEMGIVEARVYPEKEYEPPKTIFVPTHHCHSHFCWSCGHKHCSCDTCQPYYYHDTEWLIGYPHGYVTTSSDNMIRGMRIGSAGSAGSSGQISSGLYTASFSASASTHSMGVNYCASDVGATGGTVEGSASSQSFTTTYLDVDRSKPTILQVTIRCNGEAIANSAFCSQCGRERKSGESFCPKCGNKLETSA